MSVRSALAGAMHARACRRSASVWTVMHCTQICISPISAQDQWDNVKRQVQELTASSQYSNQPAIYGMVAGAEAARLRGEVPGGEGESCCFAHSYRHCMRQ